LNRIQRISSAFFVLAIPILLIAGGITYAINQMRLYEYGFNKYDISLTTGIDEEELKSVARQIRGYFNSANSRSIEIIAEVYGQQRSLFSPRETTHLHDVKRLIWLVYGLGGVSAAYVSIFISLGFHLYRQRFGHALGYLTLWGSVMTMSLVAMVALGTIVGFDFLFLWFHKISFSNDFWQLDHNRHVLIMLFPQGFWFDSTIFVGSLTMTASVLLGSISGGCIWFKYHTGHSQ
jgi:integral membrane protein (TIGR01906 family)